MLTVRWLTGTLEEYPAPVLVRDLMTQIRPLVERNRVIHFVRAEEETSLDPDVVLQPLDLVNVLVTPECEMTKKECDKVSRYFVTQFRSCPGIIALLKECHALIAGGSVLSVLCSFPVNDFDVYVNHAHAKHLIQTMIKQYHFDICHDKVHTGSAYCTSFFRQNRILARIVLSHGGQHVDVIVVDDEVPLRHVVTHFDLSFCETWWDGTKVFATDPDGVRGKEGCLQPSYRSALFRDLNPFIVRRIRKYRKRGFTVHLTNDTSVPLSEFVETKETEEASPINLEDWAIRTFLTNMEEALTLVDRRFDHRSRRGCLKAAFFFHCYPAHSSLTYDRLVTLPCWSDPVRLQTMVQQLMWTRPFIFSLPLVYRAAFLRTFHVTEAEWEQSKLRTYEVTAEWWKTMLKEFREDIMTGW